MGTIQEEQKPVSADDVRIEETTTKTNGLAKKRKLAFGATITLLLLGIIVGIIVLNLNNKESDKPQSIAVCTGEILDEAVTILSPIDYSKNVQLQELNSKIVNLPNYEKDPNCLYPIMQGYVFTGYLTKSVETFKKFESVYGDGSQFASDRFYTNLESLRQQVAGFEKRIEELRTGSGNAGFGVSAPPNDNRGSE